MSRKGGAGSGLAREFSDTGWIPAGQTERIAFGAILLLGAALRLVYLDSPQLWLDELIQLARFSEGWVAGILDLRHEIAAAPLDYVVQRVFIEILGFSDWSARLHAAVFGCLSLFLFHRLAVLLTARVPTGSRFPSPPLLATALLATYPLHVQYSREGRYYSLLFFLTVASTIVLLEAVRRGGLLWPLHVLCCIALLYSSYHGVLSLLGQGALLAGLHLLGDSSPVMVRRKHAARFCLSSALSLAAFAPWIWWTIGNARSTAEESFLRPRFLLSAIQELSGGSWPLSLIFLALVGLALGAALGSGERRSAGVFLAWFALPTFFVFFLDWLRNYFFAIRQLLLATPALLICMACGLAALSIRRRRWAGAVLGFFLLLGVGTIWTKDRKERADWKAVCGFLDRSIQPGDRIAAPGVELPLGFRCPSARNAFMPIDRLRSDDSRPRRVLLIESRYATPQQKDELNLLKARQDCGPRFSAPGFEICLLHFDETPTPRNQEKESLPAGH